MKQKKKIYPISLNDYQRFAVWIAADSMMCVTRLPGHEYHALNQICDQCEPLDGVSESAVITFTPQQLRTSIKSIELALRYLSGSEQPYGPSFYDDDYASGLLESFSDLEWLLPVFRSILGS